MGKWWHRRLGLRGTRCHGFPAGAVCLLTAAALAAPPLTTLEYKVTGVQLRVAPAQLSVPKGIAGSVAVDVVAGGSSTDASARTFAQGAYVEAVLRGPSFPARRLVGMPNEALLLPPLNLVGDYRLDAIRLVDSTSGETRFDGTPSSVPVRVFDEVLISRVTSRPLSMDETQEKGIAIDESSFRAVEFEVGFVIEGRTVPVRFPVVAPSFRPKWMLPSFTYTGLTANRASGLSNHLRSCASTRR